MKKKISIIATFRNEEESINEFIKRINNSFKKLRDIDYELIFIDDFSNDSSNELIKKARAKNKKIKLITLKKRYGHNASIQTGFDYINGKNHAVVIDCDLQDRPELIAQYFSKVKKNQTIHFVRKKRDDPLFQRFYTIIAYFVLFFISKGKIISNANYFKIIPPNVVKKIKINNEIDPYWHYLFTKYSLQTKIVYYVRKKRTYGSSKFDFFSLQSWLTFFSAIHYFRIRFMFIILALLVINILLLLLIFYNFYNVFLIFLLSVFICFLIANLFFSSLMSHYKKKNKRIYCRYK